MKVGTDGVLLGAWASLDGHERTILDIGTATGVIALMMAQRSAAARVTGVDIEPVDQACENAAASPWADRLDFVQCRIQDFDSDCCFDLIVSNPPYFVDSLLSPDEGRTTARHTVSLSFAELRDAVVRLLAPEGRFAIVLPVTEGARFEECARGLLSLVRRCEVRTTPRRAPKRVLMEFARVGELPATAGMCRCEELVIGTGEHECYTDEYRALTSDFYLKF